MMTRSDQWKFYLTVVFVLASVWTLWPTFQFYSLPPKTRQEVLQARPDLATNEAERIKLEKYVKRREKAIKLGLDLQGRRSTTAWTNISPASCTAGLLRTAPPPIPPSIRLLRSFLPRPTPRRPSSARTFRSWIR